MAKTNSTSNKKQQHDASGAAAAAQTNAVTANGAQAEQSLPLGARIAVIGVTSYLAEKLWSNRKVVTDVWYSGEPTATEATLITIFEYLGGMGLLFGGGIAIGIAMTKVAKFLPKF